MPDKFDAAAFKKWLNEQEAPKYNVSPGRKNTINGDLDTLFTDKQGRHAFLKWAFGTSSSKSLTETQWHALRKWLGAQPDGEGGKWSIRAECYSTAAQWLYWYQKEIGQMELEGTQAR
jgi:hypothetical protein